MKKIVSILLALLMAFTGTLSIQANERESINDMKITHTFAEDNIILSKDAYKERPENLVGTKLEGKEVIITHDGVYIDGERSRESVAVFVAGTLIGYFMDGAVKYVTGYYGAELAYVAIKAIASVVAAHPVGAVVVTVMLLSLAASSVQSYKTSDGNKCVLAPSGRNYLCKLSL